MTFFKKSLSDVITLMSTVSEFHYFAASYLMDSSP